jgi:hypothetical protein
MSYGLQAIRKTPVRDLAPHEHFVLEVHKYLTEVRLAANRVRLRGLIEYERHHLNYLTGRLDGYVFGMASMAIYGGWHWLLEEVGYGAMAEADYLACAYQYPEVGQ